MRRLTTFLCAMLLVAPAASFGSVADDQVTSIKLREADNNGSQNTNAGSGVKTNHIQNLAVTNAKIGDGAVTDVKISGTISGAKINGTVGNADTVDGMHASSFASSGHDHEGIYAKKYANVFVVSDDGRGDFADPVSAMDALRVRWSKGPTLLKIMPGVYNIADACLLMDAAVDIEGSGEKVTKITGTASCVVSAQDVGTEIRSITLENAATSGEMRTVFNVWAGTPVLTDVTVTAVGGDLTVVGIYTGRFAVPVMRHVTVKIASAQGAYGLMGDRSANWTLQDSTIEVDSVSGQATGVDAAIVFYGDSVSRLKNVVIKATGNASAIGISIHQGFMPGNAVFHISETQVESQGWGLYQQLNEVYIDRSTIKGTVAAVRTQYGGGAPILRAGGSRLSGPLSLDWPAVCAATYDDNYTMLPSTCVP